MCPVSYTHLDVYKRQAQRQADRRARRADMLEGGRTGQACRRFQLTNQLPAIERIKEIDEAGPVSYTHLDVYKRQLYV